MSDIKILLGIPAYGSQIHMGIVPSIFKATKNHMDVRMSDTSLLALNFNTLMSTAYNERVDYFFLLHSDIEVLTPLWIDEMIRLSDENDLAVLSVVSPIKNQNGLTSTGLDMGDNPVRKLSMFDITTLLPETFTAWDTLRTFQNAGLLINTGVLCVDTKKIDPTQCYFNIEDKIICKDGIYKPDSVPEDWNFSKMLIKSGVRYGATRQIIIKHYGMSAWDNRQISMQKYIPKETT